MAKLTRYAMKLFGSSAGSAQIAQFGAAAAASFPGTPAAYSGTTATPTNIQALSNYLEGWFAAVDGEYNPAIEDMNAICWLYAYMLCYTMQTGVPEWDAGTTYFIGSVANDGTGTLYVSLTDNNLNNALTSTTNWRAQNAKKVISVNFAASPYTITDASASYELDCTSGNIVVNLPARAANLGKEITFDRVDLSSNIATLTRAGSDVIANVTLTDTTYIMDTGLQSNSLFAGSTFWKVR
jgi:hypothetical protein